MKRRTEAQNPAAEYSYFQRTVGGEKVIYRASMRGERVTLRYSLTPRKRA